MMGAREAFSLPASTWGDAVETAVAGSAVSICAANAKRAGIIIQNTGAGDLRVSANAAVTATTGVRIKSGATLIVTSEEQRACPTAALYAIRDASTSSTACVTEITLT